MLFEILSYFVSRLRITLLNGVTLVFSFSGHLRFKHFSMASTWIKIEAVAQSDKPRNDSITDLDSKHLVMQARFNQNSKANASRYAS